MRICFLGKLACSTFKLRNSTAFFLQYNLGMKQEEEKVFVKVIFKFLAHLLTPTTERVSQNKGEPRLPSLNYYTCWNLWESWWPTLKCNEKYLSKKKLQEKSDTRPIWMGKFVVSCQQEMWKKEVAKTQMIACSILKCIAIMLNISFSLIFSQWNENEQTFMLNVQNLIGLAFCLDEWFTGGKALLL